MAMDTSEIHDRYLDGGNYFAYTERCSLLKR
jgi:hypothetical protein